MNLGQVLGMNAPRGSFGGPALADLAQLRLSTTCAVRTHERGEVPSLPAQTVTVNGSRRQRLSQARVAQVLATSGVWSVTALVAATGMSEPQASHWLRVFEASGVLVRTKKGLGQGVRHEWTVVR